MLMSTSPLKTQDAASMSKQSGKKSLMQPREHM